MKSEAHLIMNILFFSDNFPPEVNACASRVYERALYWVQWGHSVTVITSVPNAPQGKVYPGYQNRWRQEEMRDGIRVIRVKTWIAPNRGVWSRVLDFLSFMLTASVEGLKQAAACDVIVGTSPQFFTVVAAAFVAWIKGKPFVFELSDLWPESIAAVGALKPSWGLRQIERLELSLYRRSAAVIALTQRFKDNLIARGIASEKIHVIRNGVTLEQYRPLPKPEALLKQWGWENGFVVGYLGTLGMAHDLCHALYAFQSLLKQCPQARLLLMGDGAERQRLADLIQQERLSNVLLLPPVEKKEMPLYWSACDVALVHLKNHPTFETVIPSKLFEAMGMGLPILLVSPRGEAAEVLEESGAGVWIPAGDPGALADAVEYWGKQADQRTVYAKQSAQAAQHYSRERQACECIRVLQSCVLATGSAEEVLS